MFVRDIFMKVLCRFCFLVLADVNLVNLYGGWATRAVSDDNIWLKSLSINYRQTWKTISRWVYRMKHVGYKLLAKLQVVAGRVQYTIVHR